ncbi:hypothetical protein G3I59_45645 [Amycolatopsis rubida]|uniref:Uncharacterized protein n=1 Tax=Amycolatopsis rubida TaxID=112413 RepID=A0ABX0C4J2_9PSEU|nr:MULTISPECIES: hypothetical protein [Amycolatopsis]MYW97706.1 hypothetical protein [Amycolatopsis rubida]NEC62692.1 hypothetical protein [Amycolatopsis rubida]OAP28464.1 hypothetical protein A4R44_00252 [Amycolatopsis sp. M39]
MVRNLSLALLQLVGAVLIVGGLVGMAAGVSMRFTEPDAVMCGDRVMPRDPSYFCSGGGTYESMARAQQASYDRGPYVAGFSFVGVLAGIPVTYFASKKRYRW